MIAITPRILWFTLAMGCAGLALASLVLTLWLDLHPCHLCIFQRLLFMLIAALALVAAVLTNRVARRLPGGLVLGLAGLGLAVAGYQTWLQAQPPGSISCVGGQPGLIERLVEWLGQQVPSLFLATGFCEEAELMILGLSLAHWALISFAGALMAAVWALWTDPRSPPRFAPLTGDPECP